MKSNIILITCFLFFINYNLLAIFSFNGIPDIFRNLIFLIAIFSQFIIFIGNNFVDKKATIILIILSILILLNIIGNPITSVITPLIFIFVTFFISSNLKSEYISKISLPKKNLQIIIFLFVAIGAYANYCFSFLLFDSLISQQKLGINRQGLAIFFLIAPFLYKLTEFIYRQSSSDIFFLFIVLFCLVNSFILQSRSATFGCIFYFVAFFITSKNKFQLLLYLSVIVTSLVILFSEELMSFAPRVFNFSYVGGDTTSNSILGRLFLYSESILQISDKPFIGDFPPMNSFLMEHYPHNFILEILIDFGLFFGTFIIIYILYLAYKNFSISIWMFPIFVGMMASWSIYNSKILFFMILILLISPFKKSELQI